MVVRQLLGMAYGQLAPHGFFQRLDPQKRGFRLYRILAGDSRAISHSPISSLKLNHILFSGILFLSHKMEN
ncbi:hypothetical protein ATY38_00650 [Nitrosomonas ureae]|nr:hypothetical protein ATY38_00650 [Nitrosomonas ureae]